MVNFVNREGIETREDRETMLKAIRRRNKESVEVYDTATEMKINEIYKKEVIQEVFETKIVKDMGRAGIDRWLKTDIFAIKILTKGIILIKYIYCLVKVYSRYVS